MATPSSSAVKPEPGRGIRSPARDAFESYGISGRVRCKLCFQEWLKKNIEHAVAHGEDLETATKKFRALQEPPRVDVPNFHYASSAPIHAHVLEKHSELIDCKQSVKSDQRKLFFPSPPLVKGHTDKEVKAALVHCMNPTVPFASFRTLGMFRRTVRSFTETSCLTPSGESRKASSPASKVLSGGAKSLWP